MKRLVLILGLVLFATQAHSVELLVKAEQHWQKLSDIPAGTTQDTIAWLRDMWHQTHRGEIIVIRPDGWIWGGMENPPRYVVIKIPGVTMAQAAKYTQGLIDSALYERPSIDSVHVKQRRWHFLKKVVDSALVLWSVDQSFVVLTPSQAKNVVKEYDLAAIKQKIRNRLRK